MHFFLRGSKAPLVTVKPHTPLGAIVMTESPP